MLKSRIFKDGVLPSPYEAEWVLTHIQEQLKIDWSQHPLLLTDSLLNSSEARRSLVRVSRWLVLPLCDSVFVHSS